MLDHDFKELSQHANRKSIIDILRLRLLERANEVVFGVLIRQEDSDVIEALQ